MRAFLLAICGAVLGVPLSYYFQPDVVQAKVTLPQYVQNIGDVIGDPSGQYSGPFILSVVVCLIVGGIIGWFMDEAASKREAQTRETV